MERIILKTSVLATMALAIAAAPAYAKKIEVDPAVTQITINTTAIVAAEHYLHNDYLDSIKAKKNLSVLYAEQIAKIKDLYVMSRENYQGFGPETQIYKSIVTTAAAIPFDFMELSSTLKKSKMPEQAMVLLKASELVAQSTILVNNFINIVNNAKVKNPLKAADQLHGHDGANLLARNERIGMAYSILGDLQSIRGKLFRLTCFAKYGTFADVVCTLSPKDYMKLMEGKIIATSLINDWDNIKW